MVDITVEKMVDITVETTREDGGKEPGYEKANGFVKCRCIQLWRKLNKYLWVSGRCGVCETHKASSYNLVDEDDDEVEEPMVWKPPVDKLNDCMKDVKVYYPSRDERDIVEVNYKDVECLKPEA
nr:ubiquitin-like-specific protease 1D isoform X2 [Tanacetum cinerariifolium]